MLAENATIVISGARIAKEIGVSRSTVWRWVERLRGLGVKVKGQPATGYCECLETAWLLAADRKPVKLVVRKARGADVDVDALDDRAVLITTVTVPPIARR